MFYLILLIILSIVFYILHTRILKKKISESYDRGVTNERVYWDRLKKTPVAGSLVTLGGFAYGPVIVLGRGYIDNDEYIDYIPKSCLKGRLPSELSEEELNSNTISSPLDVFVGQAEISITGI